MKIVYFGTPEFAAYILEYLIDKGIEVVGVVTTPDRPAGRGHKLRPSAVKESALKACPEVPLFQPEDLNDDTFLHNLKALNADLFVVIAFRMLPKAVWDMPVHGTFNLHASLLPQYRGAAPIQYAVLNGDTESGVTTFLLNDGIDQGQILMQEAVRLSPDETGGSLHDKLMQLGAEVTCKTIKGIADGSLTPLPQADAEGLQYATKIFKEDRLLHFQTDTAVEIDRRVRAMSPYPTAIAVLGEEEIKVYRVAIADALPNTPAGNFVIDDHRVFVQCREGAIQLLEVQFPNKKRTSMHAYLLGNTLPDDQVFR